MTVRGFRDRLLKRARKADIAIGPDAADRLESYYRLLARWNTKINLTGFPLGELSDVAIDRLLIEPLAASRFMPESPIRWFDFGSGGGSPAIPLKIVRPAALLTMIESKTRKAAFLREAVRALPLSGVAVEQARVEDVADRPDLQGTAAILTMRALRVDYPLFEAAAKLMNADGRLLLFTSDPPRSLGSARLAIAETARLIDSSQIVVLERR